MVLFAIILIGLFMVFSNLNKNDVQVIKAIGYRTSMIETENVLRRLKYIENNSDNVRVTHGISDTVQYLFPHVEPKDIVNKSLRTWFKDMKNGKFY
jgi:hypothetical protein